MGAVVGDAPRAQLEPELPLLAEAHHPGRARVAAHHGVAGDLGHLRQKVPGAPDATRLLIAGECQDELARQVLALLGEQCCREHRRGEPGFHVGDAASVDFAVGNHTAQRLDAPARRIAHGEGVEMAAEDEAPPRAREGKARHQIDDGRARRHAAQGDAGYGLQHLGDQLDDAARVAGRVLAAGAHECCAERDEALSLGAHLGGEPPPRLGNAAAHRRHQADGATPVRLTPPPLPSPSRGEGKC